MRCTCCNGNKKIMKIGMNMGECTHCKGTGLEKPKETILIDKDVTNDKKRNDEKREEPREAKKTDSKPTTSHAKRRK